MSKFNDKMQLAFYKGKGTLFDFLIRKVTFSKYSHVELVIDGVCYSSVYNKGVRGTRLILDKDNWDVFDIISNKQIKAKALAWFIEHDGDAYDYRNILRYLIPFLGHNKNHWVCYEAVGAALGINRPQLLTAEELLKEALLLGN